MILCVVQARLSSSRLPGKVLLPMLGKPMLLRQLERVARARSLDKVVVATSAEPSDDALAEACGGAGVECRRGSLDDVLDRYVGCARPDAPEHVVRVTGDCPLIDPAVIDQVVAIHLAEGNDYTSNTLAPTWPDGLDVEVARFAALETAWRDARLASEREHVTPYLKKHPELFRLRNVAAETDLSALRWTVDTAPDLEFVRRVYERLHPGDPAFATADVLALLRAEPGLAEVNAGQIRDEGYLRSLRNDRPIGG